MSTARKDNLDPVFNKDFMFIFPFNRNVDDYILVLEVHDKGIKGLTFLGMCEKPMVDVMNGIFSLSLSFFLSSLSPLPFLLFLSFL